MGAEVKAEPGEQFNKRILQRYFVPARAAFSKEEQVGQDWNIVEWPDRLATSRAVGSRENDGFAAGEPIDANVQETADH